jgi:hypothetical protein
MFLHPLDLQLVYSLERPLLYMFLFVEEMCVYDIVIPILKQNVLVH